jgi:hypothetical protein
VRGREVGDVRYSSERQGAREGGVSYSSERKGGGSVVL